MSLMIVFTCPDTGRDVNSGVLVDERTLSRLPGHKMRIGCKECGREHEWWVGKDAYAPWKTCGGPCRRAWHDGK